MVLDRISDETDDQVGAAAEFFPGHRQRSAVQPADLRLDAEDLDLPAGSPAEHSLDRLV